MNILDAIKSIFVKTKTDLLNEKAAREAKEAELEQAIVAEEERADDTYVTSIDISVANGLVYTINNTDTQVATMKDIREEVLTPEQTTPVVNGSTKVSNSDLDFMFTQSGVAKQITLEELGKRLIVAEHGASIEDAENSQFVFTELN